MLQYWPSCQFAISFYRASAATANFHQFSAFFGHFWRKIKSINITNNLSFKRKPLNTAYYICLSLIIIIKSKHISLAKKFSFDYQIVCQLYKQECKLAFIYQNYNLYKYQASPSIKYKQYAPSNASQSQAQAPGLQSCFF